ncbi:MAG: hypothetical protein IPM13_13030 [Phycisphaerales bacterium]|nr:hypothetical protein [Phycisphaerales bacterium]
MLISPDQLKPGQRVRIEHTIERREQDWKLAVEGTVERVEFQKTGSWYAHSKDNRFWLFRVRLRKDDGELSLLNLDELSRVELLQDAPAGA